MIARFWKSEMKVPEQDLNMAFIERVMYEVDAEDKLTGAVVTMASGAVLRLGGEGACGLMRTIKDDEAARRYLGIAEIAEKPAAASGRVGQFIDRYPLAVWAVLLAAVALFLWRY